MANIQDPNVGTTIARVDLEQGALRTSIRPLETASRGHYRVSVATGVIGAALAANAQLFQFKWTDATRLAVVLKVRAFFLPLTAFTAATLTDFSSLDAVMTRSFAAGGGGTTLTLSGNNAKLRTSFATSLATINVATTAALTLATTLDSQPFAQSLRKGNRVNPAAATEEVITDPGATLDFTPRIDSGEYPLVLAANEGFVIRNRTVWPPAGTGTYIFECGWAEVTSY
jgi:hypothetical protein